MTYLGESAALLTSLCWSLNSVCFTVAGRRVGSAAVNLVRLLMAWGVLVLVHLALYGSLFPMQAGGARLGWLGVSGLIGFALGDAVLFEAFVLIGGALGQSVGLVFSKFGLAGDFPPISANLIRVTAGVVALLLYFGASGRLRGTLGSLRDGRATAFIGLGAITGPVLGVVLSLIAIAKAPMGVAATLMSLSPIILLPVSHFIFKEKVGGHAILGTLLALAGAAALFFV